MNAEQAFRRLKSGDETAFDAFYDLTRMKVYFAAYAVVKDKGLAEDVSQDAYVAFLNGIDRVDEAKNPVAYLVRSARNRALNAVRGGYRETCTDFDAAEIDLPIEYPDYLSPTLRLAQETLEKEEFTLVHMIAVEGYTRTEAAKILDKPLTTVSWQYRKALKKLKDALEEDEFEEAGD